MIPKKHRPICSMIVQTTLCIVSHAERRSNLSTLWMSIQNMDRERTIPNNYVKMMRTMMTIRRTMATTMTRTMLIIYIYIMHSYCRCTWFQASPNSQIGFRFLTHVWFSSRDNFREWIHIIHTLTGTWKSTFGSPTICEELKKCGNLTKPTNQYLLQFHEQPLPMLKLRFLADMNVNRHLSLHKIWGTSLVHWWRLASYFQWLDCLVNTLNTMQLRIFVSTSRVLLMIWIHHICLAI